MSTEGRGTGGVQEGVGRGWDVGGEGGGSLWGMRGGISERPFPHSVYSRSYTLACTCNSVLRPLFTTRLAKTVMKKQRSITVSLAVGSDVTKHLAAPVVRNTISRLLMTPKLFCSSCLKQDQ